MMALIDLILDQYERSSKWKGDLSGNASFRVEEEHYKLLGKSTLIQEAKKLEEEQLIRIRWVKGYTNEDIEKVEYSLSNIEQFYIQSNRTPKHQFIGLKMDMVQDFCRQIRSPWIREYTEQEVLPRLYKGTDKHSIEELQKLYLCFMGLDKLEAPIFKRIFSKRFLKNSKVFEKEFQDKIIRIARKYSTEIEDTMEDTEVLSQLYIEEYAQELSVKGSLRLEVSGYSIDTGIFPYGTVLNTQTIKNATILDNLQITKVLTIENKANYVSEPYEEGKLIIFSHGYFSPLEREFLRQLRNKLEGQEVTYLHSGDLDYGGVRIFQYIRKRIFPEVQAYRMDLETFEQYISYGEPIESAPLEKLKRIDEPRLQEVINQIIKTGLVIEQEVYL
ncbi:MAG: hypothetical protein K0S01_1200 [Herbinix sp.]|nr:hypothetical protein [Herbinix sp.]